MKAHLKKLFPPLDPLHVERNTDLPMAWRGIRKRGGGDIVLVGAEPEVVLVDTLHWGMPCYRHTSRLTIGSDVEEPITVEVGNDGRLGSSNVLYGSIGLNGTLIKIARSAGAGTIHMPDGRTLTLGQLLMRTTVWMDSRIVAQIAHVWKDCDVEREILRRTGTTHDLSPDEAVRICALLILTEQDSTDTSS